MIKYYALTFLLFLTTSCATLTGPGMQTVKITSEPSEAEIQINGMYHETPAIVKVKGKGQYMVIAQKDGYRDSYATIEGSPRILAGVVGNLFNFTGLLGIAIDFFGTGAGYKMDSETHIKLKQQKK